MRLGVNGDREGIDERKIECLRRLVLGRKRDCEVERGDGVTRNTSERNISKGRTFSAQGEKRRELSTKCWVLPILTGLLRRKKILQHGRGKAR